MRISESEASVMSTAGGFDAAECSRARKLNNVCDQYQVSYSNQNLMLCICIYYANILQ